MKPRRIGKVAGHVTRSGDPKVAYDSHEAAMAICANDSTHHPYRCALCGKWHVGGKK